MTPTMSTWCSNQLSYNPMRFRTCEIITQCRIDCKSKFNAGHCIILNALTVNGKRLFRTALSVTAFHAVKPSSPLSETFLVFFSHVLRFQERAALFQPVDFLHIYNRNLHDLCPVDLSAFHLPVQPDIQEDLRNPALIPAVIRS